MSPFRPLLAASLALLSACSPDAPVSGPLAAPRVEVLVDAVAPGAALPVRLTNPSMTRWSYNLCIGGRLDRRVDGAWVPVSEPLVVCAAVAFSLAPGGVQDGGIHVPVGATPGEYRARVTFSRSGGEATVWSEAFQVQ